MKSMLQQSFGFVATDFGPRSPLIRFLPAFSREAFNRRFRDECLSQHWFESLAEAQTAIEAWRVEYNTERPHSALGQQTPAAFSATWAEGGG